MLYIPYILINLLFDVVAYAVSWALPFFADEVGTLPKWLSWFTTFDHLSLDMDEQFVLNTWGAWLLLSPFDNDQITSLKLYIRRVLWLYRNTGYGFAHDVLGYDVKRSEDLIVLGNPLVSDTYPGISGWCFIYDKSKSLWNRGWCLYTAIQYGNSGYCINIYLGWKLMNFFDNKHMIAMRINPFMRFEKAST